MTLSDLHTPIPVDTTRHNEFRRHSSAGVTNPPDTLKSTLFPLNNAGVTTELAYPSTYDAPIITTWKRTDIEAFERFPYLSGPKRRGMASTERVPDTYDGYTIRYQNDTVGTATL